MMNSKVIKKIYIGYMVLVALMIVAGIYLSSSSGIESLRNAYVRDVAVDAMGMLAGGVLLIGLFNEKDYDKGNNAMFRTILILISLFFMDMISSYIEGNPEYVNAVLALNTIIFVIEDVLGYTYWTYIRDELKLKGRFLKISDRILLVALGTSIILDLLNVKFGMYFTVSDAGEYISMPLEFLADLAIIAVFILAAVAIIRERDISINTRLALLSFQAFPLIAYIVEGIAQGYTWIYPAYFLSVLLIYTRVFLARGKKIAEQQVVLTKQSTALMISQIQPHFLYNVLTTISNLCVTDPEEAEETTVLFSQYLRTNLDSLRSQEPVPFSAELSHIRTYVELEKKRFGDILNVEYDINETGFHVPSLGLQPIVENSIKHGIRGKNAPGHILIGTYKVENGYKILIEDDGIGFDMNQPAKEDGRSHVGMTNVKDRLKQMCNAEVTIESSPGQGCRTEIIIPED